MSEIDDAAEFAPPKGVTWVVWVGWDFVPGEGYGDQLRSNDRWPDAVELVDTRAGKLAQRFHNNVWIGDDLAASLYFEVMNPDEVQLVGLMAKDDSDLETVLTRLTALRPLSWWRTVSVRFALMHSFTHGLDRQALLQQLAADPESTRTRVGPTDLTQASTIAALPSRGRITLSLLEEVARVYREAFAAGQPPTEAVAAHFSKPRSTAGRWVSQARRVGALGPADGPRAGEAIDE